MRQITTQAWTRHAESSRSELMPRACASPGGEHTPSGQVTVAAKVRDHAAGIVRVEHRHDGHQHLTNRYHVRTTNPHPQTRRSESGRMRAATPGRTGAATVAADLRPNPEIPTDTPPPPTPARHADRQRAREEEWEFSSSTSAASTTSTHSVSAALSPAGRPDSPRRGGRRPACSRRSPSPYGFAAGPRPALAGRRNERAGVRILEPGSFDCGHSVDDRTGCEDDRIRG